MLCEMCSKSIAVVRAEVEGARLSVCEVCSSYGKTIARLIAPVKKTEGIKTVQNTAIKPSETLQLIKPDYSLVVKKAREKIGVTQKEFAKMLMERESVVHNLESGHLKPSIELARKVEKTLKVSIVEQVELEPQLKKGKGEAKGDGLTIGDLISKK